MSTVRELKTNYDRGITVDLQTQGKGVHNVASLLKLYISELPDPVLTYELMDCFLMAVGTKKYNFPTKFTNQIFNYFF